MLDVVIADLVASNPDGTPEKPELAAELANLRAAIGDFAFATPQPFWTARERKQKGSGGLLSITVNPYACKGCMECVKVCNDNALVPVKQTPETVEKLRRNWDWWQQLPTTAPEFIRIDSLDEGIGALHTLLLDKQNYMGMVGGDGACLGCGEKTVVHLFVATVEALMQPRVARQIEKIDDLDRAPRSAYPPETRRHARPER